MLSIPPKIIYRLAICCAAFYLLSACTSGSSIFPEEESLPVKLGRTQQHTIDRVTVDIEIPTADEIESYFGVDLAKYKIQPIKIKIQNSSDTDYWLLPYAIDPSYYTADEVALITSRHLEESEYLNNKLLLRNNALPFHHKSDSISEGFVFATQKRGGRYVNIHLSGYLKQVRMRFAVLLPTQVFDYEESHLRERYNNVQTLPDFSIKQMRSYLRDELPCCAANKQGIEQGDPINIVLIGSGELGISALSASGWQFTEAITIDSIRRLIGAAIEEGEFPTAPVSALYLFERKQDVALQRGRSRIDQRNHMRLWLAPFRCEGQPVWIGQISRDIGVKLTSKSKTFTTHVIDPNIDEAREYLLHSLFHSESVEKFAFVKGVGLANENNPRKNLTDDPYFTDGMRMVIWLSSTPVPPHEAHNLGWNASADPVLELKNQETLKNQGSSSMIEPLLDNEELE